MADAGDEPVSGAGRNRYAVALSELEASAHVPVEDQVEEQPEPLTDGPLAPEELDRLLLLGTTGAGRLRH